MTLAQPGARELILHKPCLTDCQTGVPDLLGCTAVSAFGCQHEDDGERTARRSVSHTVVLLQSGSIRWQCRSAATCRSHARSGGA